MRRSLALLVSALVGVFAAIPSAHAGQGSGNPVLVVEPPTISANGVTEITVRGYDYLVPPYAPGTSVFGGVYVLFGWVIDPNAFGPSLRNSTNNDGTYGVSYIYPGLGGDANLRDDGSGAIRLVAFTPGGESGGATDYYMDPDGNWVTNLRIFGSSFSGFDPRTGQTFNIDCLQVQCGIFTIGAHGKISPTNEKFTPINFSRPSTPTTRVPSTTTTTPPTTTSLPSATTTSAAVSAPSSTLPPTTSTQPVTATTITPTVGNVTVIAAEVVSTSSVDNPTPLLIGVGVLGGATLGGLLLRHRRRTGT